MSQKEKIFRDFTTAIGSFYLILIAIFYRINASLSDISLHRWIVCCNWALLGLAYTAFYWGFKFEIKPNDLSEEDGKIPTHIYNLVFNFILAMAITSLIYLMYYKTLRDMPINLFKLLSAFLFFYVGHTIESVREKLLGDWRKKEQRKN